MKLSTCFLGTLTLTLNGFAAEQDYLCSQQAPTSDDIRFLYQYNLIESFLIYHKETNSYSTSEEGLATKANIQTKIGDEEFSLPSNQAINLIGIKLFTNLKLFYPLTYAEQHRLKRFDPFPEAFVPVDHLISAEANKPYVQIFKEKFLSAFSQSDVCLENMNKNCDIQREDRDKIERVLMDKSDDKSVLFIGFSQNYLSEGSGINYTKEGYRKSLFWSGWEERPDENHNAIKFCFCKTPELLTIYPELLEFFDYIFIGYATLEYIPTETLIDLTKMLKPEGRIVYPGLSNDYIRSRFINKLFNDGVAHFSFKLYRTEKGKDFEEIYNLTSFYPCTEVPFFLHKKVPCKH